jgi:C1A family cysteine protease
MMKKTIFPFIAAAFLCVFFYTPLCWADRELDDVRHAIKQKGAKWAAGETSVSKLPLEERKKRASLHLPGHVAPEQVLEPAVEADGLPVSLDWLANGYVTGIRDQGGCGSCWAFAATAALESSVLIASQTPWIDLNLSEQVLVSCGNSGSCQGGYKDQAANFIRNNGLPEESCYPYTATDGNCASACYNWQATTYKIKNWSYATTSSPTVTAIKNALFTYGPLSTSMVVYSDFFYYAGGVYSYTYGSLAGRHAVLIVGYDDPGQYFIVKNSWGSSWGEGGFFRIAYSELNTAVTFGVYTIAYVNGAPCNYSLDSTGRSFAPSGGAGAVAVTASAACSWTAGSNAGWINITSGSSVTGNGTVNYSVSPNSGAPRTGTMTIAGQTFTVTQEGQNCTYSIAPLSQTFEAAGGTGTVNVTAPLGCSWTARSNDAWISVNSTNNGAGPVYFSVAGNSGTAPRTGTMTIAGQTFAVNQAGGCSISISPTSQSFPVAGGNGSIKVTAAGTACSWTAKSNASWITVKTVDTVAGLVAYSVASNAKNARTGTLTIGDKTFTVKQAKRAK